MFVICGQRNFIRPKSQEDLDLETHLAVSPDWLPNDKYWTQMVLLLPLSIENIHYFDI